MNHRVIRRVLGGLIAIEAGLMVPSILLALYYGEASWSAILYSSLITAIVGAGLYFSAPHTAIQLHPKDGLAIVALGWICVSIFGSLPFILSSTIPDIFDAFFETVSGFTTTGASIIQNIEALDRGIMFWRMFSHWIGAMGILVFTLALLPALGIGSFQIFKAEIPGPTATKIAPKLKNTARILYISYLSLTVIQVLLLLAGGMDLFDAVIHAFSTIGTGGFAVRADSIASFSGYLQIVMTIFMILGGINFGLYYFIFKGRWHEFMRDQEIRYYGLFIVVATGLIALNLSLSGQQTISSAIHHAFIQVSSFMTTTGVASQDYTAWPAFSQFILLILMFVGGCAGSTAGGMKVIRVLVGLKMAKREFSKIAHPRAYVPIKVNGRVASNEIVAGIHAFLWLHISVFIIGCLLIGLENHDLVTTMSAAASTLNNVGPGMSFIGPKYNYSLFNDFSKFVMAILMLLGRLELYTLIALVVPKRWLDES